MKRYRKMFLTIEDVLTGEPFWIQAVNNEIPTKVGLDRVIIGGGRELLSFKRCDGDQNQMVYTKDTFGTKWIAWGRYPGKKKAQTQVKTMKEVEQ